MALCRDRCWVWVDLVGATNSADGVMNDDEPRGQVNAQGEYSIDLGNCDTMDEILEHFGADSVRPDHPCSRSRSSCCCCCRCCCC